MRLHRTVLGGTGSLVAALSLAAACNPTEFNDYEDQAQIRVAERPESYRLSGYGEKIITFERDLDGTRVSRIAASAGAGSPVTIISAWDGASPGNGTTIRCRDEGDCEGTNLGTALAGFETWGAGLSIEQSSCVLAPGDPYIYIFCETSPSFKQKFDPLWNLEPGPNDELRFSAVGLPNGHPLGVALIGVHSAARSDGTPGRGKLMAQEDREDEDDNQQPITRELTTLVDPATGTAFQSAEDSNFGYAVAAATLSTGELMVAVSQPSHERVIVAVHNGNADDELLLRGCIRSPNPAMVGFGRVLELGDVNGDGVPDVFVGVEPGAADNPDGFDERLYMYDGEDMPAANPGASRCPDWQGEQLRVNCREGTRGIDCAGTDFGADLAVGDVNGDDFGDLIIGAPRADVQGTAEAGVMWVIPGGPKSEGNPWYGLQADDTTVLYASGIVDDEHLGVSVGALTTADGRAEPVAGAPGSDKIFTFLCSPLAGDNDFETRCLP